MILQALHDYYQRKMVDPDPMRRLPAFGFEDKEIPFIIDLACDGRLVAIKDTRTGEGRKKVATRYLVPKGVKKTFGVAANLLWGNAEYVLGLPDTKKQEESRKKGCEKGYLARLTKMHRDFCARIGTLPQADEGVEAVKKFLDSSPIKLAAVDPLWEEIRSTNPLMTFRLSEDDTQLVCQRDGVTAAAARQEAIDDSSDNRALATCLITGVLAKPARLHPPIKRVMGGQTSGANIVAINNKVTETTNGGPTPAFSSFGKQQGYNAPVSKSAAFAYTTALNSLLARGSRQRVQVGDATTVFWAQRQACTDLEQVLAELFEDSDDPDARTEQIRVLYASVDSGRFDSAIGENPFFVLGLAAPSKARLTVRFWLSATAREIALAIQRWFDDLRVVRLFDSDPAYPSLSGVLSCLGVETRDPKRSNCYYQGRRYVVPPQLSAQLVRAVFAPSDAPLPVGLLNEVISRIRAEQAAKMDSGKPVPNVSYLRASALKAYLNRSLRSHEHEEEEYKVALDRDNRNEYYRLGRLFAAYERIQEQAAQREINRTIRDAYFGSAMATPRSAFPTLFKLSEHHLRDLKRRQPGKARFFEALLGEIAWEIDSNKALPSCSRLEDQGRFALGYYHQRQAFFAKNSEN